VFSAPLRTSQETQKFCIDIMHIPGLDRFMYLGCKTCDVYAVFQFLTLYFSVLSQHVAPFPRLKEVDLEIRQPVFLYHWIGFEQKHQTLPILVYVYFGNLKFPNAC